MIREEGSKFPNCAKIHQNPKLDLDQRNAKMKNASTIEGDRTRLLMEDHVKVGINRPQMSTNIF